MSGRRGRDGVRYDAILLAVPGSSGEMLPATIDRALSAEVSSALLFSGLFITRRPLSSGFVEHLVDAVLMPVSDQQATRR